MGTDVVYSAKGYLLSQSKYVIDILEQTRITDNKIIDTSIEVTLYHTIIESFVYLTITHSDIIYVIHFVSQFVASPTTVH